MTIKSLKYIFLSHIYFILSCILYSSFICQLEINQYCNYEEILSLSLSFSLSLISYLFIVLRRGRRRFHVSGCRRSEWRIRQLQQTRPSGGLQKVLHMPWGHRQGIRLPDRHRFQDRRRRWQRRLRGPRGCSRMVSIVFNVFTILSPSPQLCRNE